MNLVLIGPQGSGKGTQAQLLVKKFNLVYFSPGEVLRDLVRKPIPLARKIDEIMNKLGKLIPDDLMLQIMDNFLVKKDLSKGILFDGYPRNLAQAKLLDNWLAKRDFNLNKVIYFHISRKESVRRLNSRLECPKCEAVFNILTKPPKKKQICDSCGAKLIRRVDDKPKAIKERLEIYQEETAPLIEFYRKRKILEEVDGEQPVEVIFADILGRLAAEPMPEAGCTAGGLDNPLLIYL